MSEQNEREVDAAIAAAVQAEREEILDALQQMRDAEGDEIDGRGYGLGLAQAVVKARLSPTMHPGEEWVESKSGRTWTLRHGDEVLALVNASEFWWVTYDLTGAQTERGTAPDLESAKRDAVAALVRQGWYRETSSVDVLAVVREYIDARANCDWRTDTVKRYAAASDALRALVAPRTAEESSGAHQMMGFRVVPDESIPPGEIHLKSDGYTVGEMVNMDAPAKGEETTR